MDQPGHPSVLLTEILALRSG